MRTLTLASIGLSLCVTALAQQSDQAAGKKNDDPFKNDPTKTTATKEKIYYPQIISSTYETFSLSLREAAALHRRRLTDTALYKAMIEGLESGSVKQENFAILRSQPGLKSTSLSVVERIYPTEYEPPELPNSVGIAFTTKPEGKHSTTVVDPLKVSDLPTSISSNHLATPATPTTYDTKNVGLSLEIDPAPSSADHIIDLRIEPRHTSFVKFDKFGRGLSEAFMPRFEEQSINTSLTVKVNQPSLLGTMNRPPASEIDPEAANKVWFAFVTVQSIEVK